MTDGFVIDTTHLNRDLDTVKYALLDSGLSGSLYHVEAGVTIRDLYQRLEARGLALQTMGGASGQTLAGAVSTGTHGGDKTLPPLADSVRALHLVGRSGAQYWIEPSARITDPVRIRAAVAPQIRPEHIIYDDATFNACLVSLGCMGVVYGVVLAVRPRYDLVERTVLSSWNVFKAQVGNFLADPTNRFLQVLLDPYTDGHDNPCLVTTRSEASSTVPLLRPDRSAATANVVQAMLGVMYGRAPWSILVLWNAGVIAQLSDPNLPAETKLGRFVDGVLRYTPYHRQVLIDFYPQLLLAQFPTGAARGSSFSVMDLGYGRPIPLSQPGLSVELHFDAAAVGGRRQFVDYVDSLIATVNAATKTYFAGYVSLRFTGQTRATLGMQQWKQTCCIEVSTVQGVTGLADLLAQLYKLGYDQGALPHWGQLLDLNVQGDASRYPGLPAWRAVYARFSNNFTTRTFENQLSSRWHLTRPK